MSKLLILVASPQEFPRKAPNLFFTGIGKINAAMSATRLIIENKPDLIINIGTAGSYDQSLVGLVECGIFTDRDNDFLDETIVTDSNLMILSTGDSFVTEGYGHGLVDMEAFAIAKVCEEFGVKFKCFKYVTDYVGHNSVEGWRNDAHTGLDSYLNLIRDLSEGEIS